MNLQLRTAELSVLQRPYAVKTTCPHCEHEWDVPYADFVSAHGDPPDWNGATLKCPSCGGVFLVDGQDWS